MNLNCTPLSLFSWNFKIEDGAEPCVLTFNWMSEQGTITVGHTRYEVEKQGMMSGEWHLKKGHVFYKALKPNPFTRRFEITGPEGPATLLAAGLGRPMTLKGGGHDLTFSPNHLFTRKATISGQGHDLTLTAFAFWLTALTWKRSAQSSN
ncbi:hypothetical protein AAFN60_04530 [Roseibacillus persicicus]|uniref:hypothetical protein n=1 Tax=Roseibacillus persicicus TaxID=454148 RepID=UPI00398AA916